MRKIGNWILAVVLTGVLAACGPMLSPALVGEVTAIAPLPDSVARRYDHFFLEAMVERQKGHGDAAFDLLQHCLEINPNAPEAYYFLAQYYGGLKDTEKSLGYFQKAAVLDPQNETYMETLA